MRSTDSSLHYRHPPASAFRLNKLLYRVRMDDAVRQRFIADPDSVLAGSGLSEEALTALKELDVSRLAALGAHPLLAFMARFNVEHDRRLAGGVPPP
jgi:hypothetical protein